MHGNTASEIKTFNSAVDTSSMLFMPSRNAAADSLFSVTQSQGSPRSAMACSNVGTAGAAGEETEEAGGWDAEADVAKWQVYMWLCTYSCLHVVVPVRFRDVFLLFFAAGKWF